MSTISPNMNLTLPDVGQTLGPQWASDLNSSLTRIDQHNHSAGSGVQVTPDGLDINSDLTIKSNNLTNIRSSRFSVQSSPLALAADLGCLYVSGVDLYFNDVNGNQIQITQSGGIAGSPGSISNLTSPASASYVAGTQTFVWQSNTNVAANLDAASIILRNQTVSSNGLTLSAPASLASNYSIVLPTLPASSKILRIDNSGNISSNLDVDNSTLTISSNQLQVANLGINTAQLAAGSVTRAKQEAVGQQISSSSGTFSHSSAVVTPITNLSVTITTTGRPVVVALIPEESTSGAYLETVQSVSGSGDSRVLLYRDATPIGSSEIITNTSGASRVAVPASSVQTLDVPAAGTYTYTAQAYVDTSNTTLNVVRARLLAYEL